MEYWIEAFDVGVGGWYILGTAEMAHVARDQMARYRRIFSTLPLQVIEMPTKRRVALDDPRVVAAA